MTHSVGKTSIYHLVHQHNYTALIELSAAQCKARRTSNNALRYELFTNNGILERAQFDVEWEVASPAIISAHVELQAVLTGHNVHRVQAEGIDRADPPHRVPVRTADFQHCQGMASHLVIYELETRVFGFIFFQWGIR